MRHHLKEVGVVVVLTATATAGLLVFGPALRNLLLSISRGQ